MPHFSLPSPGKQVYMAAFLDRVRQTGLHEAVRSAAQQVSAATLRQELATHTPAAGLQAIQGTSVRDEEIFATPSMLRNAPGAIAYYRLLLGVSQKLFYTTKTGLNIFASMEAKQFVRDVADPLLEQLCDDLNEAMSRLIQALPQAHLRKNVDQLPLLTLGAQADGSWRGQIGAKATKGVFEAMKAVVKSQGKPYTETDVSITVINNSGREVTLALAPDPDVVIREDVNGSLVYKAAIEIKGGADYANVHNRAGEAEKSHQKARADGAQDCWTVIDLNRADMTRLKQESPTTREWLDLNEILNQNGAGWNRLTTLTVSDMGI
jgi:XcyI restriction endonuclease